MVRSARFAFDLICLVPIMLLLRVVSLPKFIGVGRVALEWVIAGNLLKRAVSDPQVIVLYWVRREWNRH